MNKSFFRSFILSLFTSALLLGMASCGDGNEPQSKGFQIAIKNITPTGVTFQITPVDKEAPYFWRLNSAKEVDDAGSVEAYIKQEHWDERRFDMFVNKGDVEYVVPSNEAGLTDLLVPNTEYILIVFNLDENYKLILESITTKRFTTPSVPSGAIVGFFSIEEGKQVFFSKGNLYYDAALEEYFFFEDQWTFIGDKADYSKPGQYDLFGWGTGFDPLQTSTNPNNYEYFTEWGDSRITNAGNIEGQWRTLSRSEWDYLFFKRDRADELLGLGKVDGVNGLILMPDGWQAISGKPDFKPVKNTTIKRINYDSYEDDNTSNNHFEENNYTKNAWEELEKSGALFLPAAGERYGTAIKKMNTYGRYWSSDKYPDITTQAVDIYFQQYRVGSSGNAPFHYGASVRLVRDVQ